MVSSSDDYTSGNQKSQCVLLFLVTCANDTAVRVEGCASTQNQKNLYVIARSRRSVASGGFCAASASLMLSSLVTAIPSRPHALRFPLRQNTSANSGQAYPKGSTVLRPPTGQCRALENPAT